jgi:hypothetical protein
MPTEQIQFSHPTPLVKEKLELREQVETMTILLDTIQAQEALVVVVLVQQTRL